ncbi:hypothetical protein [Nocardia alni]|uniref:hypothetical protein n=1 Tax=Nocardia alni TaxID=2815723 RepID=UPI001C24A109|nr:hypothetical protein [Nocardia alni]
MPEPTDNKPPIASTCTRYLKPHTFQSVRTHSRTAHRSFEWRPVSLLRRIRITRIWLLTGRLAVRIGLASGRWEFCELCHGMRL